MRLLSLAFLTGVALANPFNLGKRQLNAAQSSSCSASHTAQCTGAALIASASGFCASLGHGTTTNTVRRTATIRNTIVSTRTVYTSTTTVTARPRTVRATRTRTTTVTTTRTLNIGTTRTRSITARVTGTIESCPSYDPPQTAQDPSVEPPPESTTTTTNADTTTTTPADTTTTTLADTTTTSAATTTPGGLKARQAGLAKPACLRAANALETTSACNCVIPVSTSTRTVTSTRRVTSTRTMSTTTRLVSRTTSTPIVTLTTTRVSTVTNTRVITRRNTVTVTATATTTVAYELAATPAAFYVVDSNMAFAEWPANNNDFYYNIQYDFNQTDDEFAPTVFSLSGFHGDELRVETGPSEGMRVVGQEHDGLGMQMVALEDSFEHSYPVCHIEVTADGKCPLLCNMDANSVNGMSADGLWTLLPDGSAGGFVNYVMAAGDVSVGGEEEEEETPAPGPN